MRRGKYSFEQKEYRGKIKNRITIDERPEIINERKRLGDFEIDLIVRPKNKGAILTAVDRLSRKCIIEKLSGKSGKKTGGKNFVEKKWGKNFLKGGWGKKTN